MTRDSHIVIGLAVFVLCFGQAANEASRQSTAPAFQVDPLWPKPLPNHWILGSVTGVAVDSQDHIWIVHRGLDSLTARTEAGLAANPPTAEGCCAPAPPVLEFDQAGNLISHWGGPGQGYDWPQSPGGITVDAKGNVWIAAAGPPEPPGAAAGAASETGRATTNAAAGRGAASAAPRPQDAHVLKFSRGGQFLLQIGHAGQPGDKDSQTSLNRPADLAVDPAATEVFVADGGAAPRVVVFDAASGAYKRHWFGHGDPFARLSCVTLARDGLVYVCDRKSDRIQVFKRDGSFVKETFVSKTTTGNGSVWDAAFSPDSQQRYLFVADGQDEQIFVLQRDTLQVLGTFGDGGRLPGQFYAVGSVAVDSKGNLYTGETYEGKRLQKFVRK